MRTPNLDLDNPSKPPFDKGGFGGPSSTADLQKLEVTTFVITSGLRAETEI